MSENSDTLFEIFLQCISIVINLLLDFFRREKTASWQHGVETYAAHHALAGHASGTASTMGPHAGPGHPHAGHPHAAHPHSSLAAAAPFYAQNVAMMSSWRAYDGAGFQRASPYGLYTVYVARVLQYIV